ncbi:MAG: superoxide dismutase family protein [Pseudomonadota bacterium]|nr:superoxide dismutase family protein [Pseudomonadota bacterium]
MFVLLALACVATGDTRRVPSAAGDVAVRGAGDPSSVASEGPGAVALEAIALLDARTGSGMTGRITFSQAPGSAPSVAVSIQLAGAGPGNHAVFLHETGDCSAPDASSAGGWFGPPGAPRRGSAGSGPTDLASSSPPAGYLGFVTVSADGRGEKDLVLLAFTLDKAPGSLVDRAVVVYERAPDFTRGADPGVRQACGVIAAPIKG